MSFGIPIFWYVAFLSILRSTAIYIGLPRWQSDKESTCNVETQGWFQDQEDPLEKGVATCSSILSWEFHGQRSLAGWSPFPQVVLVVKNLPANAGEVRHGFDSWVRKIPWSGAWQPGPVFLSGQSHGQRSLAGYSPQDCKVSDTTEAT